jgi:streptogramin lyase
VSVSRHGCARPCAHSRRRALAALALALPCALGSLALAVSAARGEEAASVRSYPLGAEPAQLAQGPDGELWFTEGEHAPNIGYVPQSGPEAAATATFEVTQPNNDLQPEDAGGIVAGSKDTLWFTIPDLPDVGKRASEDPGIGRVDATPPAEPAITEWALPHEEAKSTVLSALAAGPSSTIWYADEANDVLGWLAQSDPEQINAVKLGSAGVLTHPQAIAASPDGSIWVEMDGSTTGAEGGLVHVVDPTSSTPTITEYVFPDDGEADSAGRLAGHSLQVSCSGEVWVSGGEDHVIDEFDPTRSTVTPFRQQAGEHPGLPETIALAPDQSVWYDENEAAPEGGSGVVSLLPDSSEPFSYLSAFAEPGVELEGMIVGSEGDLWLGDQDGVAKVTLPAADRQAPSSCPGGPAKEGEGPPSGGPNGSAEGQGGGQTGGTSTATQGDAIASLDHAEQPR